jgi:hypothetical protein
MLLIITIGSLNTLASKGDRKPNGKSSESIPLPKQVLENPFDLYSQRNRVIDAIHAVWF